LQVAIEKGTFREDLYYRLNVVPILLPPLRDRKEDIPILANYFLKKFAKEFDKDVHEFSRMGMQKLVGYHWPGNVRELENKIQQTVVMTNSSIVGPEHIDLPGVFDTFRQEKQKLLAEFEYNYVTKLLSLHHGNISRAAKAAGMDRKNFWQLISKHKITPKTYAIDPNAESETVANKPHPGIS
jgi:two-component system, NtrC family, response regulator GlrR